MKQHFIDAKIHIINKNQYIQKRTEPSELDL